MTHGKLGRTFFTKGRRKEKNRTTCDKSFRFLKGLQCACAKNLLFLRKTVAKMRFYVNKQIAHDVVAWDDFGD